MEAANTKAIAPQTKRRFAIFIDGTWNVEDNNTNVWRLYSLCSDANQGNDEQLCFYTKGVGTAYGSKFKGGVLGMGFTTIIRQTYDWLISHYRKGDEIFIFGFSRGLYAARSLAGLVAHCGIPISGSPVGTDEVYQRYKHANARTIYKLLELHSQGKDQDFTPFEKWMVEYCLTADITMVGVWDTVGALIGNYDYLETGLRLPIKRVYHALAIDEHRFSFEPTLLTRNIHSDRPLSERSHPRAVEDVEQRWFPGAHANLGGGYESDPLSQRPLDWIANKAIALGLKINSPIVLDADPWSYPVRNSFREFAYGLYQVLTIGIPHYRTIGQRDIVSGTTTTETVNETIDASVFERWQKDAKYRPTNISRWATHYETHPAQLTGSVLAKDPTKLAPP